MKTPKKLIRYSVAVSPRFPSTHCRKGEPTYFKEQIIIALMQYDEGHGLKEKLHTIRKNYPMWVKRMEKVNSGEAVIDLFYWKLPGGRYTKGNEPVVFATLDKDSGCGVQHLTFSAVSLCEGKETPLHATVYEPFAYKFSPVLIDLAKNDGLSLDDFKSWFKGYDLSEPMAIIHFTKFRY